MSTAIEVRTRSKREILEPRPRVLLRGISWETYEQICDEAGAKSHVRMIYDGERLEIVSPLPRQERFKYVLGRLIADVLIGLQIPFEVSGESRWKAEAASRGLEADDSFFITFEKIEIVGGRPADQSGDPVPDLAIEVDTSEQAADRVAVYQALGIPELWTYDGDQLRIFQLEKTGYRQIDPSRFLPVTAQDIADWVEKADGVNLLEWVESLQSWLRNDLIPSVSKR